MTPTTALPNHLITITTLLTIQATTAYYTQTAFPKTTTAPTTSEIASPTTLSIQITTPSTERKMVPWMTGKHKNYSKDRRLERAYIHSR